ncbi:MAG: hypothetical protein CM15mP84_03600 [Cellvibrionales bacterium]|nr:MAG: hypothetical protein CM15mP84_03600 [Cellvibrionales bacterium]
MKSFPRYLLMVFALAGDSTMTSALPIERYDPLFKKTATPSWRAGAGGRFPTDQAAKVGIYKGEIVWGQGPSFIAARHRLPPTNRLLTHQINGLADFSQPLGARFSSQKMLTLSFLHST